jgi:hypothetical protein
VKVDTFFMIWVKFQENYSNFGQILLIFVKFHEILLQFQENYSNFGQIVTKFDTFFMKFGSNFKKITPISVKFY